MKDAQAVIDKDGRLAERRRIQAGSFSGGERRQLEIPRALMMGRKLLLVDGVRCGNKNIR